MKLISFSSFLNYTAFKQIKETLKIYYLEVKRRIYLMLLYFCTRTCLKINSVVLKRASRSLSKTSSTIVVWLWFCLRFSCKIERKIYWSKTKIKLNEKYFSQLACSLIPSSIVLKLSLYVLIDPVLNCFKALFIRAHWSRPQLF